MTNLTIAAAITTAAATHFVADCDIAHASAVLPGLVLAALATPHPFSTLNALAGRERLSYLDAGRKGVASVLDQVSYWAWQRAQ